ncbi:hypothetical protein C7G41_04210 [Bradyrhizobium sp. MOS002]|nr:hypothetical protein C7G41_04210 [Bradyrhizobium sp. MOS002]
MHCARGGSGGADHGAGVGPRQDHVGTRRRLNTLRHCEKPLRRSNPDCFRGKILDCFAALAMTG